MYDYVIVGAGSAGCVLANRLSEDPDVSVCLVEAGPPDTEEGLHIPVAFSQLYKTPFDWDFATEPEPALDDRSIYLPRGRVLGGSSSLNAMIYIRGNRRDYDEWRDLGNAGWGWDDVLPYFLRAEDNERGASEHHGAGGPLTVSDSHSMHPLADAFVEAGTLAGIEARDDFNTGEQDGVGRYQLTQRNGMRCSTAVAYLHPVLSRPNVTLVPMALVTRVLFDGSRASGVEAVVEGKASALEADREVILCAGAYQSPQLLMLSGIGPADELSALGVDVRLDQPAVGGNLQDHLNAGIILFTDDPTTLETAETEANVALLQTHGRGPLTSNIAESGGFWRSRDGLDAPDVQFHFAPVMFADEGLMEPFDHAYSYGACVVKPSSRGRVSLRSADPSDKPRILTNFLGDRGRLGGPDRRHPQVPGDPRAGAAEGLRARALRGAGLGLRGGHPCARAGEGAPPLPPGRHVRDGLRRGRRAARARHRRPARGRRLGDADAHARQHQRAHDHDRRARRRPRARNRAGAGGRRDRVARAFATA